MCQLRKSKITQNRFEVSNRCRMTMRFKKYCKTMEHIISRVSQLRNFIRKSFLNVKIVQKFSLASLRLDDLSVKWEIDWKVPCVFALKVVTHKNGPAPFAKRKIENRKSAFPAIKRVRFGAEKVTAQVYKRRKDGSVNSVIVGVNHPSFRHLKCQKMHV
jgi:hypothetical protein